MVALGPLSSQPVLGTCRSSPAANANLEERERVRVSPEEGAGGLWPHGLQGIDRSPSTPGGQAAGGRGQAWGLVPFLSSS